MGLVQRGMRHPSIDSLEPRALLAVTPIGEVPSAEFTTGGPSLSTALTPVYPNAGNTDVAELNGSLYYLAPTSNGLMGLWRAGSTPTLLQSTAAQAFSLVSAGGKLIFLATTPGSTSISYWTSTG